MAPSGSPENVRAEGRGVTRPEGQGEVVIGCGERTGEGKREKEGERRQGEGEQGAGGGVGQPCAHPAGGVRH